MTHVAASRLNYQIRTFAYLFICLRQHGTFFFVLGDFGAPHQNHQEQEEFA
jgi:hypothetical protein